ncbi:MAG: S9 family peptidase [Nocardioides sp.]
MSTPQQHPDSVAPVAEPPTPTGAPLPPIAERRPATRTHHGQERHDDYDWLRDREAPEVLAYLEAENAYTDARTAHLEPLRQALFDEIKARTVETDLSVPSRLRGHWYYSRSFEGREYGASCRVPVTDPADWTPPQPAEGIAADIPALPGEELLLDLNELAEGHDFFSLGGSSVSFDGNLLAYGTDVVGDERYIVRVLDLTTRELLPDELVGTRGSVTWVPDGSGFYYTTMDASWRSNQVWFHRLGEAQSADLCVFTEDDERFWVGVGRSRDDRYLLVMTGSKTTSEWHLLDLTTATRPDELWCFAPRRDGLEYGLEPALLGDQPELLILHNGTGPDFAIGRAPMAPTPPEEWVDWEPHRAGVRLEGVDAWGDHVVISERSGGLTRLRILTRSAGEFEAGQATGPQRGRFIEFPQELYTVGIAGSPSHDSPVLRLGYTSLTAPSSVYSYDLAAGTLTLLKQAPVLGGYDPSDYHEERLWATAPDGVQVPISLVCRRDLAAAATRGPAPLLLYGYGAYEYSMDPYFSIARLSLLDRGVVFALAHVRGGGEMGRGWYDDGKLGAKQHSFDDFAACARALIEAGWTTAELQVAEGGSAGGLLMGAVANQAPELFTAIVAQVPFVDPLTTMLDPTLPLTITEYDEWGNPSDDPAAYATIAAYAPYDNVADQDYPALLVETSLQDTRVLYAEPAKWVARLRAVTGERCDVLLKTELAAGHAGVSGRYQAWRERAFTLAWILDRMGRSS